MQPCDLIDAKTCMSCASICEPIIISCATFRGGTECQWPLRRLFRDSLQLELLCGVWEKYVVWATISRWATISWWDLGINLVLQLSEFLLQTIAWSRSASLGLTQPEQSLQRALDLSEVPWPSLRSWDLNWSSEGLSEVWMSGCQNPRRFLHYSPGHS